MPFCKCPGVGTIEHGRLQFRMRLAEFDRIGPGAAAEIQQASGILQAELRNDAAAVEAPEVEHAHEKGVVHRDVKPENVIVDDCSEPQLVDFGLARFASDPVISVEGME